MNKLDPLGEEGGSPCLSPSPQLCQKVIDLIKIIIYLYLGTVQKIRHTLRMSSDEILVNPLHVYSEGCVMAEQQLAANARTRVSGQLLLRHHTSRAVTSR